MNGKLIKSVMMLVMLAVALIAMPAFALDPIFTKNATGSTAYAVNGTSDYVAIATIPGDNNKQIVITSIDGTSTSTTTGNIYVYAKENEATVNIANTAGGTGVGIASGGGSFDANDKIVIQSPSGDVCFYETISAAAATTLTLYGGLDYAISVGYKVYEMELIATLPINNSTVLFQSDVAVVAGAKASPLLLYLPGKTTSCTINFASGMYK